MPLISASVVGMHSLFSLLIIGAELTCDWRTDCHRYCSDRCWVEWFQGWSASVDWSHTCRSTVAECSHPSSTCPIYCSVTVVHTAACFLCLGLSFKLTGHHWYPYLFLTFVLLSDGVAVPHAHHFTVDNGVMHKLLQYPINNSDYQSHASLGSNSTSVVVPCQFPWPNSTLHGIQRLTVVIYSTTLPLILPRKV